MLAPTHIPVLAKEVIKILQPQPGDRVLDLTLGLGGHAKIFLQHIGQSGQLVGVEADSDNLALAKKNLETWKHQTNLIHDNFGDLASLDLKPFDVIFADLGLSSPHVDDPHRGFTFRTDAPLDLRYDRTRGKTAAQRIAAADQEELKEIFSFYGEFTGAKRLAERIEESQRKEHRALETTQDLRCLVEELFGYRATRLLPQVFQALRIWTNDELKALAHLLDVAPSLLKPGGRLGIISYHSLEDRMVKRAFKTLATPTIDEQTGQVERTALFELCTKKAVAPTLTEIEGNPRARSAHFRAVRKKMC